LNLRWGERDDTVNNVGSGNRVLQEEGIPNAASPRHAWCLQRKGREGCA
jgi:hypothetical protein